MWTGTSLSYSWLLWSLCPSISIRALCPVSSLSPPDCFRHAGRQNIRRGSGNSLHCVLYAGVRATPDLYSKPEAVWSKHAQHGGPDCYPATLPADGARALWIRRHPLGLWGHWDSGTCWEGKSGQKMTDFDLIFPLFICSCWINNVGTYSPEKYNLTLPVQIWLNVFEFLWTPYLQKFKKWR